MPVAKNHFVLLHHQFPSTHSRQNHWDLMLEENGKLLTWALSAPLQLTDEVKFSRLPDHRTAYLQYEGPVSDDRGSVSRVISGTYEWTTEEKNAAILETSSDTWKVTFEMNGKLKIEKLEHPSC